MSIHLQRRIQEGSERQRQREREEERKKERKKERGEDHVAPKRFSLEGKKAKVSECDTLQQRIPRLLLFFRSHETWLPIGGADSRIYRLTKELDEEDEKDEDKEREETEED